ncbi:MAG: flagellar protein [Maritimibacter sp.]|nr:flagellar protein [Maritimibacter sp.]
MTYTPVVPVSGYAGWAFLSRTRADQQAAFDNSTTIRRNTDYFAENIASVQTAEDLVADRRLLQVALGAFGLDEDINSKYFLQKVLEDGTLKDDALANRLSDKRYFQLSKAFGFGDFDTPRTVLSTFADEITDAYRQKQFEIAVGEQDESMRLALGLDSALSEIATRDTSENGRWFTVMGQAPVRRVFEYALGMPASVGALDLDQQLTIFRDKAAARFGDGEVAQFTDPAKREELVKLFLLRSQTESFATSRVGESPALTLLQNAGGAGGLLNILTG